MNREQRLRFEIVVVDILEELKIKDTEELEYVCGELHENVEAAVGEYANDESIEYDRMY